MNEWEGENEFIFSKLSEPAILGIDFLNKFGASFGFSEQKIIIKENNQVYRINMIKDTEPVIEAYNVELENKVFVKANSENLVKIKVKNYKPNDQVMFEPKVMSIRDLACGIVLASSLNTVQEDGTVFLSVLNASGKDVFVDKEAVIGCLCYAEEQCLQKIVEIQIEMVKINKKTSKWFIGKSRLEKI
ncbi:unnamed protein product [Brachionus calyciflorus]|uniref:Uncharacterized protein n=1 Tax=Brachionus calyciflorus TaxID=104777 RepID=A0A813ZUD0_9BILA|nr:unnamed protein product [Brachionus calyciflorus]